MGDEEYRELLEECLSRGERELLYRITKLIAESDSIGEGSGYCSDYSQELFLEEINDMRTKPRRMWGYIEVGLEIWKMTRDG